LNPHFTFKRYAPISAERVFSGVLKVLFLSPLSASVISGVHVLCRDNFWYWETVVLVQTLGLVAAQVFAIALDGFFQLTITLLILVAGALALAHCHPFEQEGPQFVQVCDASDWTRPDVTFICVCSKEQFLTMHSASWTCQCMPHLTMM